MPVTADNPPNMQFGFSPDSKMLAYALATIPASMLAGVVAHQVAKHNMMDDSSASPRRVERFAKRHLGQNVVMRPVEGMGNAAYSQEKDEQGNTRHVITYDPRVKMSVIAHEIGHADWQLPSAPAMDVLGPTLLAYGSYRAGKHLGRGEPIGTVAKATAGAGAGLSVPTLVNEYLATQRAKEMVDDPAGLTSAYATYALPPVLAGLEGLGSYAMARHLYKNSCDRARRISRAKRKIVKMMS